MRILAHRKGEIAVYSPDFDLYTWAESSHLAKSKFFLVISTMFHMALGFTLGFAPIVLALGFTLGFAPIVLFRWAFSSYCGISIRALVLGEALLFCTITFQCNKRLWVSTMRCYSIMSMIFFGSSLRREGTFLEKLTPSWAWTWKNPHCDIPKFSSFDLCLQGSLALASRQVYFIWIIYLKQLYLYWFYLLLRACQ